MLLYLLKRLCFALPVLWVLASLIFIVSRQMPGTFASEVIFQEQDEAGFRAQQMLGQEQAYQEYLIKTGLNLPVFYFSIGPMPEPDTLYKVFPETERAHLKSLAWYYGNWPLVADYSRQLNLLIRHLSPAQLQENQKTLYKLESAINPENIHAALQQLYQQLPGNQYVNNLIGSASAMAAQRKKYAYLVPGLQWHGSSNQYHQWVAGIFRGELGYSYRDHRPVQEVVLEALQNTWPLVLCSMLLTFILALEISIFLMQKQQSKISKPIFSFLYILDSIPLFVLCLLLLLLFANASVLQIFPSYGMGIPEIEATSWWQQLSLTLHYLFLPVAGLTLCNIPYITNQLYRAMADEASTDYVRTAKAKGLSNRKVIRHHILRNALLPAITLLSDFIPLLVAGAVITEAVFSIPGMGSLLVTSVQARDYPVIVAVVLVVAAVKVISYLAADVCYALTDPRINFRKP